MASLGARWVFVLMVLSFGVYPLLLSGWRSNRKYSFLGRIRAIAQTISYEIVLTLLVFLVLVIRSGVTLGSSMKINNYFFFLLVVPPFYFLWIFRCVAESNRSPFDFSEGERELVSGFNTEFGSGLFALIFMAEYLSILFLRILGAGMILSKVGGRFFFIIWVNRFI